VLLNNTTKDETNGNVLELLEARGYIKEIAGSVASMIALVHF
jgi:hypothetical protein